MFLKNIKLTNFRNYSLLDLNFDKVTLLIGDNAQGKSNILEAVSFLATTKSVRVEKETQLIRSDAEFSLIEGLTDSDTQLEIGLQLIEGILSKRVKVNGVPRRVVDYIGNLVVVSFTPEDINLVTGSPSLRRWHLDVTLAQVDRDYKRAITEYTDVITSRNRVLKRVRDGEAAVDELDFWTQKALDSGLIVSTKRQQLFDYLNQQSPKLGNFGYIYKASLMSRERLGEYQAREIQSASSLIGPHRDDFEFQLNGQPLSSYGSRGEQRTAVLDLKLLELKYLTNLLDNSPVLLLDDVFSELDDEHRNHVIQITQDQQTIISAVANENIPNDFLEKVKVVRVENGTIL